MPNLGVVRVGDDSFVIADIPGLIEGAADGAGLGVQFLKHLARTRLLLHLIDIAPVDGSDPASNFRLLEEEVKEYSGGIAQKPRWLVFTKLDVLSDELADDVIKETLQAIDHDGPVFRISAISNRGTTELSHAIQSSLVELNEQQVKEAITEAEETDEGRPSGHADQIRQEVHDYSTTRRELRRTRRLQSKQDSLDDDDEFNGDVHYEP